LPLAGARTRAARAFDRRCRDPSVDPRCEWTPPLIYEFGRTELAASEVPMTAMKSWFLTVIGVLGLVLVLHHLGVDVTGAIAGAMHGAEQILGRPLMTVG
jgi:hypothetical protein